MFSDDGYGYGRMTSFEQSYICHSVSSINRPQLENGDKIIMPASALDRLASMQIEYPMLFQLRNTAGDRVDERVSHCGVLEFVAEEGKVNMPEWMMQNMGLQEGHVFKVKNVGLPKGSYIKLQPHSVEFLDISNLKAVLENALRSFTCLTTGDTIMVGYNGRKLYIDVKETKPADAVSVVETDCEVDFAPPLDYKEPVKPAIKEEHSVPEFRPFTGTGRRLDGKPVEETGPVSGTGVKSGEGNASGSKSSGQVQGKVVFGSKKKSASNEPGKRTKEELEKEEPKFQAFTGKGYSLK